MKILRQTLQLTQRGLLGLAAWALALMLVLVFSGVVMRYLAGSPLAFTEELAGLLLVICFFFSMATTIEQRGDIRITLLSGMLRGRARKWLWRIAEGILLAYLIVFAWQAWKFMQIAVKFNERSEQASLLQWPWKAAVLLGLLLAAMAAVRSMFSDPPPPEARNEAGAAPGPR